MDSLIREIQKNPMWAIHGLMKRVHNLEVQLVEVNKKLADMQEQLDKKANRRGRPPKK